MNEADNVSVVDRISQSQWREPSKEPRALAGLIGNSDQMRQIFQLIANISRSNSSVLIQGESGTGKELVARAIYRSGPRCDGPFIVINCSALAETLLESELFGHVKGAFTGAIRDKMGLFRQADGGTIFLDEIGEVPLPVQVKLLRVLQDGEVRPLGAARPEHTDVRVIAATNRNLRDMMGEGRFREDLYYRLNVIGIQLPPLRERREDIPLLAYHFLKKYAQSTGHPVKEIARDAMDALQSYQWVGNVRELENVLERAVVLASGDRLTARDLPARILREVFYQSEPPEEVNDWLRLRYREAKEKFLTQFNRRYIGELLRQTDGNISLASQRAGMDRNNFKKIIKRFQIDAKTYKKS